MNLDHMIQLAEDQARRVLIGTKEQLTPMWLMLKADGDVEVAATPWSAETKRMCVEAMRDVMRSRQVIAYSLLVEAWYSTVQGAEARAPYKGLPPSERADRKEAVVAMAANHLGDHRYRQFEIIRDKRGRCKELKRLGSFEDKITSSLFDNLLQSHGRAN